jgi:nucleoside-diphosphate-sugar epimerase
MKFTVLGASGFIGSNLVRHLRESGHECFAPERDDPAVYQSTLGHVIYCIGLTADFRTKPFETVHAHVCVIAKVLEESNFESLLYLSSTRVYGKSQNTNESSPLMVCAADASDLYNISKLMGESLCLSSRRNNVRVARLSNVYGKDFVSNNFICSLVKDAVDNGFVMLHTTLDSAKDYVGISDVIELIPKIAMSGKSNSYNIASGINVSNAALVSCLDALTDCRSSVAADASKIIFPVIDIRKIEVEFDFRPSIFLDYFPELVEEYRSRSG